MDIRLIRLRSDLSKKEKSITSFNEELLNEINADGSFIFHSEKERIICPLTIFFIESGGSEEQFKKIYERFEEPYFLLSTNANNSLAASLEIHTFLSRKHLKSEILVGDEIKLSEEIKNLYSASKAHLEMRHESLGVIGKPSDWLIGSSYKKSVIKKVFGLTIIDITMEELKSEIDKKKYPHNPRISELKKKWKNKETMEGALFIYGALKRLITKYNLSGFSIRCFDLLDTYKNTACLALSLLNDEGITSSCEGDVPSLITMHIIRKLTGQASFQCNPSRIDLHENSLVLAHCTIPLSMCDRYKLDTHFESGLGVAIKGELPLANASIIKISPDFDTISGFDVRIIRNLHESNLCRTQIEIKPCDEYSNISELLSTSVGNHYVLSFGSQDENLNYYFRTLKSIKTMS